MSFYSSLVLAANAGVKGISEDAVTALLKELGFLKPDHEVASYDGIVFGNLSDRISELFKDDVALQTNDRVFCPDSVGFSTSIEIHSLTDDLFEGPGYAVRIHGGGYFFPWEAEQIRRVANHPMLESLRRRMNAEFGGYFVSPESHSTYLAQRRLSDPEGWQWFKSES